MTPTAVPTGIPTMIPTPVRTARLGLVLFPLGHRGRRVRAERGPNSLSPLLTNLLPTLAAHLRANDAAITRELALRNAACFFLLTSPPFSRRTGPDGLSYSRLVLLRGLPLVRHVDDGEQFEPRELLRPRRRRRRDVRGRYLRSGQNPHPRLLGNHQHRDRDLVVGSLPERTGCGEARRDGHGVCVSRHDLGRPQVRELLPSRR